MDNNNNNQINESEKKKILQSIKKSENDIMNLTKEKCNFVKCPAIKESPVSIECKVKEIKELGSHHMFIAEVLAINADKKYIDEKGAFDITKCNLVAYANGKYFSLGKQIRKIWIFRSKKEKKMKKTVDI